MHKNIKKFTKKFPPKNNLADLPGFADSSCQEMQPKKILLALLWQYHTLIENLAIPKIQKHIQMATLQIFTHTLKCLAAYSTD